MKKQILLGTIELLLLANTHAISCEEATNYLMKAAAQIRANHQTEDSFDIYNQERTLNKDTEILNGSNYQQMLTFAKDNCLVKVY